MVEIRIEESINIRQYVYLRKIEIILFKNSDKIIIVIELFIRALPVIYGELTGINAYWAKDLITLILSSCN